MKNEREQANRIALFKGGNKVLETKWRIVSISYAAVRLTEKLIFTQ